MRRNGTTPTDVCRTMLGALSVLARYILGSPPILALPQDIPQDIPLLDLSALTCPPLTLPAVSPPPSLSSSLLLSARLSIISHHASSRSEAEAATEARVHDEQSTKHDAFHGRRLNVLRDRDALLAP